MGSAFAGVAVTVALQVACPRSTKSWLTCAFDEKRWAVRPDAEIPGYQALLWAFMRSNGSRRALDCLDRRNVVGQVSSPRRSHTYSLP